MNESERPTETEERVQENQVPARAPEINPTHDDRSPLDVAFPEPKTTDHEHEKSTRPEG